MDNPTPDLKQYQQDTETTPGATPGTNTDWQKEHETAGQLEAEEINFKEIPAKTGESHD